MINVDQHEISKFEALANRWWDPNSEFKPLHDINPLRCNFIDLHSPVVGKQILDVGCGGGLVCEGLSHRGAILTGIDMGDTPLSVAKLHALETGLQIDYRKITVEELAQEKPETFDMVTCLEMLEHVPDPAAVVQACAKLTKPGGDLYFSTISRNPKAYMFAIIGAEYLLNLLPKGTHDYGKFIRPSELASWLRSAELDLVRMTGMTYNPITKRYKLDPRDVSVNYIIHAQKTGN